MAGFKLAGETSFALKIKIDLTALPALSPHVLRPVLFQKATKAAELSTILYTGPQLQSKGFWCFFVPWLGSHHRGA